MAKSRKFKGRSQARDTRNGYLFLLPWIIGFVLFTFIPIVISLIFGFALVTQSVSGYKIDFNGLTQYVGLFNNPNFTTAVFGFLQMELSYVPVIIIMSFLIALVLTSNIKGLTVFRTIFFLPVIVISGSLVAVLFPEMAQAAVAGSTASTQEALNEAIREVSVIETSFLYNIIHSYSPLFADIIVYIYDSFVEILWFTGIPIVLFINGLQKINKNLYEAAQIDGANKWQILWKVIIPNVRGLAAIIAVFSIVQLSIMPTSPLYGQIGTFIADVENNGLASAASTIYSILILVLVGISFFLITPKEKKIKEVVTRAQNEQLQITLAKMEKEAAK